MKNFAIIGVGGYIAPRHLRAIKETGNNVIAAIDKSDSVGIIDSYFPHAHFFTEFERFDRYLHLLKQKNTKIDYISICTPNYLHDSHIRYALNYGTNAICEKPLVINPRNIDGLLDLEKRSPGNVYNILQLRLHPEIIKLKESVDLSSDYPYDVELEYITSRGNWYHFSWKGDYNKSGGLIINIGVHFFDMLQWIFGEMDNTELFRRTSTTIEGHTYFRRASVNWKLSIDENELPDEVREAGQRTFRRITVEGKELEFSNGFTDLHTESYKHILEGNGFGIKESKKSIEIISNIKKMKVLRRPEQ